MFSGFFIIKRNNIVYPNYRCTEETKRCCENMKSPYFRYEYFGKETPVCCATHLYNIFKDIAEILETNHVEYFISFGTLLGAVRHGGLIPWDTDVDIVISDKDLYKTKFLLHTKLSKYIVSEVEEQSTGKLIRVYLSLNNSLHVDIYTYIEDKDIVMLYNENYLFLKSDLFPLKKIAYYDMLVYAPNNIQKHLEACHYGSNCMNYAYKQWAWNQKQFKIDIFQSAYIEKK